MSDIKGFEVKCTTCGKRKAPIGRSLAPELYDSYCTHSIIDPDSCEGYNEAPYMGWLFHNELWSESFGDMPMPAPSACYIEVKGATTK